MVAWGVAAGWGETTADTFLCFFYNFYKKEKAVSKRTGISHVGPNWRKVEDTKGESEVGMKLKIGIFAMGRMKKIQTLEILHREKAERLKRA